MSRELGVGWVGQETSYFCGPACAQMVAAFLGAASPGQPPTWQQQIWDEIETETNARRPKQAPCDASACDPFPEQKCEKYAGEWFCWATAPGALQRVLDQAQSRAAYAVSTHDDEQAATAALLQSVERGSPGLALVYGWQHWVVVDGYLDDQGGTVTHVSVCDPAVDPSDVVDELGWEEWDSAYLWSVPAGQYKEQIVVLRGEPRPPAGGCAMPLGQGAGPAWSARFPARKAEGRDRAVELVSADRAVAVAHAERRRLLTRGGRWEAALAAGETDRGVRLVERLDCHDHYTYMIDFRTGEKVTARMLINARTAGYARAIGVVRPGAELRTLIDPDEVLSGLWNRRPNVPGLGGRVLRRETIGRHPVLVWMPCRQSMSPFMPFYQFSVGDRLVYLRADGIWFSRLTTGPA